MNRLQYFKFPRLAGSFLILAAILMPMQVEAAPGDITTVVGPSPTSPAFAGLSSPSGISLDSAGNLYIADRNTHRIRKVDAVTGLISTVAGTGVSGFSGDGGAATAAQLQIPSGISLDGAGNLYIADKGNRRIRRVDAVTGFISTVAGTGVFGFSGDGGAATAAQLSYPYGISLDSAGNLYIADLGNQRIRKVDAVTGLISTVAGTGVYGFSGDGGAATAAQLSYPAGISFDSAGNFYIADLSNHRIRKVEGPDSTPPTGTISIDAGATATNSANVNLTLSCTDNEACSQMQFSNDNITWGALVANATSVAHTLVAGVDGIRTVYARFTDAAGNISAAVSDTITLDTVAPIAPVISSPTNNVLINSTVRPTISGTAEANASVNVLDGGTSLGLVTATGGNWSLASGGATLTEAIHSFTATATDAANNASAASTAMIYTVDVSAPVIATPANITVEATAASGAAKTVASIAAFLNAAITSDAVDGAGLASNNAPATFPIGATIVTFSATDTAGNAATSVVATVTVSDTVAPVIVGTPLANVLAEATGLNTAVTLALPSATDAVGVISVTNNAPATFPIGTTVVIWTATDAAGNTSFANQSVVVSDTTAPIITLLGDDPHTLLAGQSYVDAGATASDLVDGALTVTVNNPVTNPVTEGVYIITYDISDAAGNAATQVIRTVTVTGALASGETPSSANNLDNGGSSGGCIFAAQPAEQDFVLLPTLLILLASIGFARRKRT